MLDYYRYKDVLELFVNGQAEEAKYLLMELQARHIALTNENSNLKNQVQEYEDILFISKNLLFDGSSYWLMTSGIKQGPFCRDCYAHNGQLIRLVEMPDAWRCPSCGSRWFWQASLDASLYRPIFRGTACPACQHDFATPR